MIFVVQIILVAVLKALVLLQLLHQHQPYSHRQEVLRAIIYHAE